MNALTKVFGTIQVKVFAATKAEVAYLVDTVLNSLPEISKGDGGLKASFNVSENKLWNNYNRWDQRSNLSNVYGLYDYYNEATITLCGDLHNIPYEVALKEVAGFLNRLSKRLYVKDILLRVSNSNAKKTFVFDNSNDYLSRNYDPYNDWNAKFLHTTMDYNWFCDCCGKEYE